MVHSLAWVTIIDCELRKSIQPTLMAEVIGVIASGISVAQLAGQVTHSVLKLKSYWEQIEKVPTEIRCLMRKLDSLNTILGHIQEGQARKALPDLVFANACVEQSLELCKEGEDQLSALVEELREKIDGKTGWKKRIASAKVVLRKEELKILKRRMKNSISLLTLAYGCHTK